MIIIAVYDSNRTGGAHDNDENRLTSLEQFRSMFLDMTYPVGAIYMSTNATSPATLFGGTWSQIQDKFLLCAGSSYSAGSTGGEATHTLTEAEMPRHIHKLALRWTSGYSQAQTQGEPWVLQMLDGGGNGVGTWPYGTDTNVGATNFGYTGNSIAHNNMPPYLAVYVWQRTA